MTRDIILSTFTDLAPDDVRSTSMGSSGVDIQLSPAAAAVFPYSVECKNHAKFAVYGMYDQCVANSANRTPLLVIKQNHSDPLAVVSLKHFMELTQIAYKNSL